MYTLLEPNPAESAANEPTIEEIESWESEKLLEWIQQKLSVKLKPEDGAKLLKAEIDGELFIGLASHKLSTVFEKAGLSIGVSSKLAKLAREAIGSKSKCCRSILYTLRRQPANNVIGDSSKS